MNDLEQRLRADLHAAVDELPDLESLDGPTLRAAATVERRGPARLVIALAVAATLIGAVALVSTRHFLSGVPTSGPALTSWDPRGDESLLSELTTPAVFAWESAFLPRAELPHHRVRALFAADTVAGKVIVLEGVDALGTHRVAVFGTNAVSTTAYRDRLHLLVDHPVKHDRLQAFDIPRPTPRPTEDRLLLVLAPPGTRTLQWREADEPHWQDLPTSDGTVALVHQQRALNVDVRVGRHGSGVRTYETRTPDHLLSEREYPPDKHASGEGLHVVGSNGATLSVGGPDGTDDLRSSSVIGPGTWTEFGDEIQMGLPYLHSSSSYLGSGGGGSGLLPDDTGLYLDCYSGDDGLLRAALYVDRPEVRLPLGEFWLDRPVDGPLPAVLALLQRQGGRWVAGVVARKASVEVSVDDGPWRAATRRGDLMYLAVPNDALIKVRVRDGSGAIVREGAVDTTGPITR